MLLDFWQVIFCQNFRLKYLKFYSCRNYSLKCKFVNLRRNQGQRIWIRPCSGAQSASIVNNPWDADNIICIHPDKFDKTQFKSRKDFSWHARSSIARCKHWKVEKLCLKFASGKLEITGRKRFSYLSSTVPNFVNCHQFLIHFIHFYEFANKIIQNDLSQSDLYKVLGHTFYEIYDISDLKKPS